ncbi:MULTISPECIES: hypothetical protein [Nocardiopsis]|uniref:Uncharacterized protein n=1 Tax=Nocardiopsis dassonvillei (strain ATCC 23218 / DSM 43111 / CIP 107115 / JCM 7437 / KCTC 9190 / NBRC 14626 / NCTC 10488 / NRRL B-5397 / IMRU 509) TaxID=446468 RepID=D7B8R4_NOCDD|nr:MULTISPECIES: hypothetical protein [Nocardiopsis]ADH70572.1 hypothetical protein Ndas_5192 [Nocardiopsis dassonvillei subsp. dassonvillei DSM 43111]APC38260.1 hypothetical protein A9R04_03560 [Nocardiopsis dassonvillei]NKY81338.1 hypothetical protein [Nocardiopsis dassonvillei]VEI91481.1 Uncharacterised protein [Nocardiopsis dassonvillei]
MASNPELDQVADARRKLAAHTDLPAAYWVFLAAAGVLIAGLPIWSAVLPGSGPYFQWAVLGVVLVATAYSVVQRRRSGVYMPRYITSYPGARLMWIAALAVAGVGYIGINLLVDQGMIGFALAALVPVAALVLAGQMLVRSAVRRSIENGRVK